MPSSDEWLLLACVALCLKKNKKKMEKKKKMEQKKKLWMPNWYKERNKFSHENLLVELKINSKADYRNFLRMDSETFDELLSMVSPLIRKQNTVMRKAIPANLRLSATLRYLATGEKFEDLKFLTAISPRSIGTIVIETCEAIISSLANYIKVSMFMCVWYFIFIYFLLHLFMFK